MKVSRDVAYLHSLPARCIVVLTALDKIHAREGTNGVAELKQCSLGVVLDRLE